MATILFRMADLDSHKKDAPKLADQYEELGQQAEDCLRLVNRYVRVEMPGIYVLR